MIIFEALRDEKPKHLTESGKFISYLSITLCLLISLIYGFYSFYMEKQKLYKDMSQEAQAVSISIDKLLDSYQIYLSVIHDEINKEGSTSSNFSISRILERYSPSQPFNLNESLVSVIGLSWVEYTDKSHRAIGSLGIIANPLSFTSQYLESLKVNPDKLQLSFDNEEYIDFGFNKDKEESLHFINLRLARGYLKDEILKNFTHHKYFNLSIQNNKGDNLLHFARVESQSDKDQYSARSQVGKRPYYIFVGIDKRAFIQGLISNLSIPLIFINSLGLLMFLIALSLRNKIYQEAAFDFKGQLESYSDLSQKQLEELNEKSERLKALEEYRSIVKKGEIERIKYQSKIKDYLIKMASENSHMSKLLLTNINGELGFDLTYEKQLSLIMKLYENSYYLASQIVPKVETKKVNINNFISECVSIFERRAYEHNIGIHFKPLQTVEAYVDEVQFKQMFMSLLSKAIDRAKSYISIKTEYYKNNSNSYFTIEILDDGFLVSEEAITKFNQFKRSNYDNLALDWKNVERLVEIMEGKLIVESKSDQKNKLVVTFSSDKPKTNKDNQFHEDDDKSNKIIKIY